MPLKNYILMYLYILLGGGFFFAILIWVWRSLHKRNWGKAVLSGGTLLIYSAIGLTVMGTLLPCFNLYQKAFCRGSSQKKQIAITFDDGPSVPYTSQVLDILKEKGVRATFFIVGDNLKRHPKVVERIKREGHMIGNHSSTHSPFPMMGREEIYNELGNWEKEMSKLGISYSPMIRTPRGWKSPFLPKILQEKGYRLMGWSRGVWDSDEPGVEVLRKRLSKGVTNGEIILLHDGEDNKEDVDRSQTVEVLGGIIDFYRAQGFKLVALDEMVRDG